MTLRVHRSLTREGKERRKREETQLSWMGQSELNKQGDSYWDLGLKSERCSLEQREKHTQPHSSQGIQGLQMEYGCYHYLLKAIEMLRPSN